MVPDVGSRGTIAAPTKIRGGPMANGSELRIRTVVERHGRALPSPSASPVHQLCLVRYGRIEDPHFDRPGRGRTDQSSRCGNERATNICNMLHVIGAIKLNTTYTIRAVAEDYGWHGRSTAPGFEKSAKRA